MPSFFSFNVALYSSQCVKINHESSCQSNMYFSFTLALRSVRNFQARRSNYLAPSPLKTWDNCRTIPAPRRYKYINFLPSVSIYSRFRSQWRKISMADLLPYTHVSIRAIKFGNAFCHNVDAASRSRVANFRSMAGLFRARHVN